MTDERDTDEYLSAVVDSLSGGGAGREYEFWKAPDLLEELRAGRLSLGQLLFTQEAEEFKYCEAISHNAVKEILKKTS